MAVETVLVFLCQCNVNLLSVVVGKDLFGAEPFDPFTCGAADFPPDIQSKLDEMQVSVCLGLIPPHRSFCCFPFLLRAAGKLVEL